MQGVFPIQTFVSREPEIEEISYGLEKHNTVLLVGNAGIGKTTIARYYEYYNPLKFRNVLFFNGIEFDFDDSKFALLKIQPQSSFDQLIIIDGFDEIYSEDTRQRLTTLVKEGRKYGIKLLLTSRPYIIDRTLQSNSFVVTVPEFNQQQAADFLKKHLAIQNLDFDYIDDFVDVSQRLNNIPLLLNLSIELLKGRNLTPGDILGLLRQSLHYKNELIEQYSSNQIILPNTPKIITDVSLINQSLIDKVNRNPRMIYEMSSRQFEELVAELFDKEGYSVKITPSTRDGGKDLLIIEQKRIGNFIIYVECKKYSIDNPVGVRLVRELYGTVIAERATAGVLVTSSYFTNPAVKFTEQIKSQLSLIDYSDLKKWIDDKAATL